MKLKCDTHKLRVHAVDGKFIHRSGSELCNSGTATIGEQSLTAIGIQQFGLIQPPRSVK